MRGPALPESPALVVRRRRFREVSGWGRERLLRAEEEGGEPHWADLAVVEQLVRGGHGGGREPRGEVEPEAEAGAGVELFFFSPAGAAARGAGRGAEVAAGGGGRDVERRVAGGAGRRADEWGGARAAFKEAGEVAAGAAGARRGRGGGHCWVCVPASAGGGDRR